MDLPFDPAIPLLGIYPKETKTLIQKNKQVLARMWRKGNPHALLVGMQIGAATVGNIMEFPQKIKSGLLVCFVN